MSQEFEARIEALVERMTTDEKVRMAAGSGLWYSSPVERLGIPALKMSDGPNGVRGDGSVPGMSATGFPSGTALAASWDPEFVAQVADALAVEALGKGVDVLLGPTINLHRTPVGGRNFECWSEDPWLTGELAVAYVRALQARGVAACPKHFVCNDSEFHRHSLSVEVDERTLHEVYLRPFERAVREGGAWTLMAAYNRLRGAHCAANEQLLRGVLKGRWGFDGVVISDWGGTYSTVGPARAGLDLEMPGPAVHMGARLDAALAAGEVPVAAIEDKVRRQLRLLLRTGRLDAPARPPEQHPPPAHAALALRAAIQGTVLLRNVDDLLPLEGAAATRRIALIGPNAVRPVFQGGGSSEVNPAAPVSPEEGLRRAFPQADVRVARGCSAARYLPLVEPAHCRVEQEGDRRGWRAEFHADAASAGEVLRTTHPRRSTLTFFGEPAPGLPRAFGLRLSTWFTPTRAGVHRFSLVSAGRARLRVDDAVVVDNWDAWRPGDAFFGAGSAEAIGEIELDAETCVRLSVEFANDPAPQLTGLRIGHEEPETGDPLAEAEALARWAEVAVVIAGLDADWEGEGADRVDLRLPGAQEALIRRVAAANPRTVLVLNAGSPIALDGFADAVPAILQVWYPGQAFGAALGDVLTGVEEPGGRLPSVWPASAMAHPSALNYPGEFDRVRYGEGIFIGQRGMDRLGMTPAFPLGYGLGYTRWRLGAVRGRVMEQDVELSVEVENLGSRAGAAVVQAYVQAPAQRCPRPERQLCAFGRVTAAAGARALLTLRVTRDALAYYDTDAEAFRVEAGAHRFHVGFSAADCPEACTLELAAS
ncbi:MAG: glycoside hydrolase family 3 C-terminal domain-containing protein [Pseudomonadales bacterium]|nr:glycoside hydrolase family 3 C-terminal domain-containing protein [Pseudomonadales bacterium]